MIDSVLPDASRSWVAAGALACLAAAAATGWSPGWLAVAALSAALAARRELLPVTAVVVVGVAGWAHPIPTLAEGPVSGDLILQTSPAEGRFGHWALGTIHGVAVYAEMDTPVGGAGRTVAVSGRVTAATVSFAGRPRQILEVETAEIGQDAATGVYGVAGASVREHVLTRLSGGGEERGLLAGFVVGDTSRVGEVTTEAMRRAGLFHFVAVSGSNVALFLGLVFVVAAPIGLAPRRRAVAGLLALPVFVVATGFEPSVVRAATMAGIVLAARLFDLALEVWQVIGLATVVCLAIDPWLVRSVGFQLSLAATCGVVAGARARPSTNRLMQAGAISLGAQLAVSPLLLAHFGTMPLLSPLANLLAAPLVSSATVLAMVAVGGVGPALVPAEWLASAVISLAHMASGWPQVGWTGLAGATCAVLLFRRLRRRRPMASLVAAAVALTLVILPAHRPLEPGQVAVLDVGQGDAILLKGGEGAYALVDGGSDPAVLVSLLREFGVRRLDLVVMTHGDADHAGGLAALPGLFPVEMVWERAEPHHQEAADRFLSLSLAAGYPVAQPRAGSRFRFGVLGIEVVAPTRRFASPNDQSIVLLVTGPRRSMLLTGDIEVVGQAELPAVAVDVLKVPHHGAGTSDPGWLASTGATEAVVSVGDNDFGHPVPWVISTLQASGAIIRRTDVEGTIVVDLR